MKRRDHHIRSLKKLLIKLGIKSARSLPGINLSFEGIIIHKPGIYARIINVDT